MQDKKAWIAGGSSAATSWLAVFDAETYQVSAHVGQRDRSLTHWSEILVIECKARWVCDGS